MRFDASWPEGCSVRKRTGFLWFPKVVNGDGRWWEHAEWWEECAHYYRRDKPSHYNWEPVCWAD
ncbi:MAG: hypothetical protein ACYTBJ_25340, partial [Planctomycetota bacterium]